MKKMARMGTKKSYSWWWDSHISPKNSKWLAENLEDMDRCVKEMLQLIEQEGDSFAKKADMYYQRRPDLIAHVGDFYRMYRALAERYDNVTGELRRNVPSELQSQGSGNGSDFGSESDSPSPEHIAERKPPRPKSGKRPAGFEYFLGSRGSSDLSRKESDGSSSSETESDTDDSKDANGDVASSALQQRILVLENELHAAKEKLSEHDGNYTGILHAHIENGDHSECTSRTSSLEKQLMDANDKLRVAETEILSLKQKLVDNISCDSEEEIILVKNRVQEQEDVISVMEAEILQYKQEIENLKGSIKSAAEQFEADLSHRDVASDKLKAEISSLSEKYLDEKTHHEEVVANLEGSVENLKAQFEADLSNRDVAVGELKAEISSLSETFLNEKACLEVVVVNLKDSVDELSNVVKSTTQEKILIEAKLTEQDGVIEELEANAASSAEQFLQEKTALEAQVSELSLSHATLEAKVVSLVNEIKQLEATHNGHTMELNDNLTSVKLDVDRLMSEKEELGVKVNGLLIDVKSRDGQISEMNEHLNQLHLEHVKLITETEAAQKEIIDLKSQVKRLECEVNKQNSVIMDISEEKREVIRQLCFSLEHYQDGYRHLCQKLRGNKRPIAIAT